MIECDKQKHLWTPRSRLFSRNASFVTWCKEKHISTATDTTALMWKVANEIAHDEEAFVLGSFRQFRLARIGLPRLHTHSSTKLASENGQIDTLEWIRSQDRPCPWNERAYEIAAETGEIEAMRWLRAQIPPWGICGCAKEVEKGWGIETLYNGFALLIEHLVCSLSVL